MMKIMKNMLGLEQKIWYVKHGVSAIHCSWLPVAPWNWLKPSPSPYTVTQCQCCQKFGAPRRDKQLANPQNLVWRRPISVIVKKCLKIQTFNDSFLWYFSMKCSQIPVLVAKMKEHNFNDLNSVLHFPIDSRGHSLSNKPLRLIWGDFSAWKTITLQNRLKWKEISLKRMPRVKPLKVAQFLARCTAIECRFLWLQFPIDFVYGLMNFEPCQVHKMGQNGENGRFTNSFSLVVIELPNETHFWFVEYCTLLFISGYLANQ